MIIPVPNAVTFQLNLDSEYQQLHYSHAYFVDIDWRAQCQFRMQ